MLYFIWLVENVIRLEHGHVHDVGSIIDSSTVWVVKLFLFYLFIYFFFKEKKKFKVKLHIEVSSFPNQTWGRWTGDVYINRFEYLIRLLKSTGLDQIWWVLCNLVTLERFLRCVFMKSLLFWSFQRRKIIY